MVFTLFSIVHPCTSDYKTVTLYKIWSRPEAWQSFEDTLPYGLFKALWSTGASFTPSLEASQNTFKHWGFTNPLGTLGLYEALCLWALFGPLLKGLVKTPGALQSPLKHETSWNSFLRASQRPPGTLYSSLLRSLIKLSGAFQNPLKQWGFAKVLKEGISWCSLLSSFVMPPEAAQSS